MLRINETATQPSLRAISHVKMDKQRLIGEWEAWAELAAWEERLHRHSAVGMLRDYLNQPDQDKLVLSHFKLTSLPEQWPATIKKLDVSRNQLTSLPATLPDLMQELDVSDNQLEQLPVSLPSSLSVLSAYRNKLVQLSAPLPANLRELSAYANKLTLLPATLPDSMVILDVSHNQLNTLPAQLPASLTTLKVNFNKVASLPATLPNALQQLHASCNQLTSLPVTLPAALKKLYVSGNQLTQLPDQIPAGLQLLYISNNQLQSLPAVLPNKLQKLDASFNQLRELPDQWPSALIKLFINNNQLRSLPATLPDSLEKLYLDHNQLRELPDQWPSALIKLSINNNQLRSLPATLPDSLAELYLDHNQLRELPDRWPSDLIQLSINNNQLSSLPATLPDSLEELHLDHNQLRELPDELPISLAVLSVANNQLTRLPDQELLASRELNVSNNRLRGSYLDLLAADIDTLIDLDISGNIDDEMEIDLSIEIAKWTTDITPWETTENEQAAILFSLFLQRIRELRVDVGKALLKERVIELLAYLAKAENSGLRERLLLMADDAISSCQDRIFYYFNQMYVAMLEDQLTSGQTGIQGLFSVNRSLYRLQILNQLAAEQVVARRQRSPGFNEEIEIYLAYQCLLREPLALPIYTQLEHIEIAQVTEVDIKLAIAHVLKQEQRHFIRYLVTESSSWQHRLEQWNRSQVQADNEAYLAAIEGEAFNQQVDAQLRQHGIAADDTEARVVMVKEQADALRYQQRYQLSCEFLKEQQALDLIDGFTHP